MSHSVLLDTSFLVPLVNNQDTNHSSARAYYKYFINHGMVMYLSTIVIMEFHQRQSIVDLVKEGNFVTLTFNYFDAVESTNIAHELGFETRASEKAEFKDDIKLIGQARNRDISFILTNDAKTLDGYCRRLYDASFLSTQSIRLSDGFDGSWFNNGQRSLYDENINS